MTKGERFASESIPMDCWELILSHLNQEDLISTSLVCKDFLKISNNFVKNLRVSSDHDINLISQPLKRFRKIESITFNIFEGCMDYTFKEIASNSEIKSLKIFRQGRVVYDLLMIANHFPSLEQLQICRYQERSPRIDLSAAALSSKFKFLRKVNFEHLGITDIFVDALSLECALLEDVRLYFCNIVTETGIGCLLRNRPNLKALWIGLLGEASTNSAINIENSICHAKALASLKVYYMDLSDRTVKAIADAKLPLKEFALLEFPNQCSISVLSEVLHSSKHLRKLSFVTCDTDMKLLFRDHVGQNISHIDIEDSPETTVTTLSLLLTKCPSLVELRMQLGSDHPKEDVNFPFSEQYQNIRIVTFTFTCEIFDAFVIQMGHSFPNLQILELLDCNKITSRGIEAVLGSCSSITKLILGSYKRTMLLEADNSQVLNLEELELISSAVDDEGLAAVAQRCCRLVSLKLNVSNNVSTEGIKHIVRNIKSLKYLELADGGDLNCNHLLEWMLSSENTVSLKKIYISGTVFTYQDINRFLQRGCLLFSDSNGCLYR